MDELSFLNIPRPFPDRELFKRIRESGFARYPERKENFIKFKASQKGQILDYLPVRLDIENVSRCNYSCAMCQVSEWPKQRRANDMTLKAFKELVRSQYGLLEIKLQGMGEPLLGKSFCEMIKFVRSRDIWIRSTTNGSLLHLNENYKRVIDSGICELQVSIDGATPETYERIRNGGILSRVLKNCERLNKYCEDEGIERTRMWVVVQKKNFHEIEMFPSLASKNGFSRLTLALDLDDWGQERWMLNKQCNDVRKEITQLLIDQIVSIGKKLNVEVTFWIRDKKFDTTDPEKLCPWPFEWAYITSDFRIVPCCMLANPSICDLGDAKGLRKEWNNKNFALFRKSHLEGNIPYICKNCYCNH